jgi:hypothetical protein
MDQHRPWPRAPAVTARCETPSGIKLWGKAFCALLFFSKVHASKGHGSINKTALGHATETRRTMMTTMMTEVFGVRRSTIRAHPGLEGLGHVSWGRQGGQRKKTKVVPSEERMP